MSVFGVMIATNLSYLLAFWGIQVAGHGWYTPAVSSAAVIGLTIVALFGLRVGKWLQGLGGAAHLFTFAALIMVPFVALGRGTASEYQPLALAAPSVSLLSLNIFGKMALGALSGFEYVAILAGECRNPAKTIGQSVVIAAPVIAVMFILGTSSVLALVPQREIDLVSPIPQALSVGFAGLGFVQYIVPVLIVLLLMRQIGNVTLIFAGNTRLPMVAGWDRLVPGWFSKLHPRYRTPSNSIFFVGAITLLLTLVGQIGVGLQEAFQILENAAGILYAFTYLALFAVPLFGAARLGVRPPLWLRLAAISGFAITSLYSVLSIFPIIDVENWTGFSLKIVAVLVGANIVGIAIYRGGRRSSLLVAERP
jgi:glutamate:GABA antiporter